MFEYVFGSRLSENANNQEYVVEYDSHYLISEKLTIKLNSKLSIET